MTIDLARIEHTKYYRQAAAAKIIHVLYPFRSCFDMTVDGVQIPVYYDQTVTWLSPTHQFFVYFGEECLLRVSRYYAEQEFANPGFAQSLHDRWKTQQYQPLIEQFGNRAPASLLPELMAEFRAFSQAYRQAWGEAIFHDGFDFAGEQLIQEIAGSNADEVIRTIHHPFITPYQEERRSRLALLQSLTPSERDQLKVAEHIHELPASVAAVIEQHTAKYHWIRNDYATVQRLAADYFLLQLKEVLVDPARLAEEQALTTELTNQNSVPSFDERTNQLIKLISLVGAWRDERKAMMQQAVAITQSFLEDFARLANRSVEDMEWLEWTEIVPWLNGDAAVDQRLKSRKAGVLDVSHGRDLEELYGNEGLAIKRQIDCQVDGVELKGRVAYQGHVRGTAKLIFDQRDFHKFEPGDILIAPNTRPEYLPIMRHASAVVTEEGGLTSHAAIVARELNVPTIVGVQGVTLQIKESDTIKVDATTGVIQKIVDSNLSAR